MAKIKLFISYKREMYALAVAPEPLGTGGGSCPSTLGNGYRHGGT